MAAVGRTGSQWFTFVIALLILVSPPATLISRWFNTLIQGLALATLYACLGCTLSPRAMTAVMPLFVAISFMAYTTYPVLILAVCLARADTHRINDLAGLVDLFILSFGAVVLTAYTLNYFVHGTFGIPLGDWRNATPTTDLDSLVANLGILWDSVSTFMVQSSFGFAPVIAFHLLMLVAATAVLVHRTPGEAAYLSAGLWLGMGLMVTQEIKNDAWIALRGYLFAWVFYALIIGNYAIETSQQFGSYSAWQTETRQLAAAL